MGLMGAQGTGGGLGKMQHSPIKPAIQMESGRLGQNASMVTPGEMESIAGLIG